MDKHVFYFQDENLNAEKALHGTLKMIVGVDGISMLALGEANEVLWLESMLVSEKKFDNQHVESELQDFLSGHKLLNYTFGTVRTALSVPLATLVPERLFSTHDYAKYFHLLQPDSPETIFGQEALLAFGCHLVWGATTPFQAYANRYQPRHLAGVLIDNFHALASGEGHSVFMNIRGNYVQIIVFDLRNLLFYNTFEFNKPADLLYVVLLVFDQFRMNPEQVPLQVTGALLEGSEHYKMLYKYVQNIRFITPNALAILPEQEQVLPAHYWFDILSL